MNLSLVYANVIHCIENRKASDVNLCELLYNGSI